MKKAQFDQLFSDIESQASEVKYDFQIAEKFSNLLDTHKADLTPEQLQQAQWDFLLFRLTTKNKFSNDGVRTERFVPMAIFADGSVFPDPKTLTDDALNYYESRSTVSTNPILKARYLDILWEKSKSKKKHLYALEAVEQYLLNADEYENEDAIIERLDGLQRATELVLVLEKGKDKRPVTDKVVAKLHEQIDKTEKSGNFRWLIEMFELVIALAESFSPDQIKRFVSVCEKAVEHYYSSQNFHLQRSFLTVKAGLVKIVSNTPEKVKEVNEEVGQSYIDEAEAKSDSGLVKAHFLQEAIDHYKKLGDMDKVNMLIGEVKKATKQAIDNKEFKQISSTVELKQEDWQRMKNSLGTGEEVPENMGTAPTFFPNWDHAIKMTEDHSKKFVFMHLVAPVTYSDQYPISAPRTPEQEQEDRIMGNYKIEVELAHHWLTGCVRELIKEKKLSANDFKKFLSKLEILNNDTYETVWTGVESYFKEDHFQAIYVLTTQLEDLLRRLLNLFGGQTTTQHIQANAFTEKNLNRILIELKPHISEQLYRYISWVMDDYRGYNLRYKVGHGFFKKKHAHAVYSTALLHIFCLLIANTKISVKKPK